MPMVTFGISFSVHVQFNIQISAHANNVIIWAAGHFDSGF